MNKRINLDNAISQMSDLLKNQNSETKPHEKSRQQPAQWSQQSSQQNEEISLEDYVKVLDQKQALVLQILEKEEKEFNLKKQENKNLKSSLAEVIQKNHAQSLQSEQQVNLLNQEIASIVESSYSTQINAQLRKKEFESLREKINETEQQVQAKLETSGNYQIQIKALEEKIAAAKAELEQEQQMYAEISGQQQQNLNEAYKAAAKEFADDKIVLQQLIQRENKLKVQITKLGETENFQEEELKKVKGDLVLILKKANATLQKCDEIEKLKDKIQLKIDSTNADLQDARQELQQIEQELKNVQRSDVQIRLERDSFKQLMQEKMQIVSQLEKLEHFAQFNSINQNLDQIFGDSMDISQKQQDIQNEVQKDLKQLMAENAEILQAKNELELNFNNKNCLIAYQKEAIKKFQEAMSSSDNEIELLEDEKKQICFQIEQLGQEMDKLNSSYSEIQQSLNCYNNNDNEQIEQNQEDQVTRPQEYLQQQQQQQSFNTNEDEQKISSHDNSEQQQQQQYQQQQEQEQELEEEDKDLNK